MARQASSSSVRVRGETFAAVILLGQPVALDHRAHGAVEDEDALLKKFGEFGCAVGLHGNTSKSKNPFSRESERVSEEARFSRICNAPAS